MPDTPAILLVDNGSLQPAATLNLRRLAAELSERVGRLVEPVSLLHSSAIDAGKLEGRPAEILEPAIRRRHAAGVRRFIIVPLFFGPSAALTDYIPDRIRALESDLGPIDVRLAEALATPASADAQLASLIADQVREVIAAHQLKRPWVILVDHGSPQRAVAEIRDRIASRLVEYLDGSARSVVAASMERREGDSYAFNEPLLERALEPMEGPGIVALLFFSPGRHAGPGGDIERICRAAGQSRPGLRIHFTPLVGTHPGLVDILAERLRAVI